jgi:hypothetical protein
VGLAQLQEAARNFTTGKGGSGSWDEWANDRTSLWVHDLSPYLDALTQAETEAKLVARREENKADSSSTDAYFVPTWITRFDGAVYSLVLDMTPVRTGDLNNRISGCFFCRSNPYIFILRWLCLYVFAVLCFCLCLCLSFGYCL